MSAAERRENRLAAEASPYLLQHKTNPVDWYPWGEEAFTRARELDRPIFLSVGYATCHWCHVMERESFENDEVAALMNELFVNVKVDREERPDVDAVYMTFLQALTGGGGWPMSVFLLPSLKPFFAATYLPPDTGMRPGVMTIMRRISSAYKHQRAQCERQGDSFVHHLSQVEAVSDDDLCDAPHALSSALLAFSNSFDSKLGGFSPAPKFPRPVIFDFLFTAAFVQHQDAQSPMSALHMATFSLSQMAEGGLHDILGGGFHRYSVDKHWLVSHFEKMLYDQAQLLRSFCDGFQSQRSPLLRSAAQSILHYVSHDLRHPEGGFFCAEDADSLPSVDAKHKIEGAFYTWSHAEIARILEPSDLRLCEQAYGVTAAGNIPPSSDPHGELTGMNVLHVETDPSMLVNTTGQSAAAITARLAHIRATLLAARERRPRPQLDDKILASWNGLMISALCRMHQAMPSGASPTASPPTSPPTAAAAAQHQQPPPAATAIGSSADADEPPLKLALDALRFVRERMFDDQRGRLLRSYRTGPSHIDGFADDYAFVAQAALDAYACTLDVEHLRFAERLMATLHELFAEREAGGYYDAESTDTSIVVRVRQDTDNAEPSPSAVAARVLVRLAHMTGQGDAYLPHARRTLAWLSGTIKSMPRAAPEALCSLLALHHLPSSPLVVLRDERTSPSVARWLQIVHSRYHPFLSVVHVDDLRAELDVPQSACSVRIGDGWALATNEFTELHQFTLRFASA